MTRKTPNQFAAIIAERQKEVPQEISEPTPAKKERSSKRGNPDYSSVTVYIPTEIYAQAQFKMTRKGRKREMSELFAELLQGWLKEQD